MKQILAGYVQRVEVGPRQEHDNLSVYPLLSDVRSTLDALTLDEALLAGAVEVTEIDPGGSVPEIRLANRSARRVLILDGEELVGAKQNRVVNATILVEAGSVILLPVSCVEAGRWSYDTHRFRSEERVLAAGMRASKAGQVFDSVRASRQFRSDQWAIWREIEGRAQRRDVYSPSMALSEIYEKDRPSLEAYLAGFRAVERQVGALFLIDGKVAGLDSFDGPGTLVRVFRKLVASYALDAIDRSPRVGKPPARRDDAAGFLAAVLACGLEPYPSVGLGTDCRIVSDRVTGFALLAEGQVVHLSAFRKRKGRGAGKGPAMERPSARRQRRL